MKRPKANSMSMCRCTASEITLLAAVNRVLTWTPQELKNPSDKELLESAGTCYDFVGSCFFVPEVERPVSWTKLRPTCNYDL